MYITLLTPPVVTDRKIETISAHLTEHLIGCGEKINEKIYFKEVIDTTGDVYSSYTKFYYPDEIGTENIIKIITLKLNRNVYIKEKKAVSEELKSEKDTYIQGLGIRISKLLYGKKYVGDYTKIPDFAEITKYHKKYYKTSNIIISDDNDKILFMGEKISLQKSLGKDTITYHAIEKDTSTITCLCFSHTSSQNHRLAYFIHQLLDNYLRYTQRYNTGSYFYDSTDYFKTYTHLVVAYTDTTDIIPSRSFFSAFQTYFYDNCFRVYDTYWKIIDSIHGVTPLTNKQYKEWIKNLSYAEIVDILKKA